MKNSERVFSFPGAMFLLLVIAAVAVYLVKLVNSYHAISTLAVLGTQAKYAAQSGLEWGKKRAQPLQTSCFADQTLTFTSGA